MKIIKKTSKEELHDSEHRYRDSIVMKRFVFEFFSYFMDLFYVAFINFDILALKNQLIALYSFDEVRRVASETIIPLIRNNKLEQTKNIVFECLSIYFPQLFSNKKMKEEKEKNLLKQTEEEYFQEKLKELEKPKYEAVNIYILLL